MRFIIIAAFLPTPVISLMPVMLVPYRMSIMVSWAYRPEPRTRAISWAWVIHANIAGTEP